MNDRVGSRYASGIAGSLFILLSWGLAFAQYEAPPSDSGHAYAEQHARLDLRGLPRPWLGTVFLDQRINWSLDSLNILRSSLQDEWKASIDGSSKGVYLYQLQAGDTTGIPIAFDYDTYRLIKLEQNTLSAWKIAVQEQLRLRDKEKARDLVAINLPFKLPKAFTSVVGEGGAGLKVNGVKRISFSGKSQWRDGPQTSLAQSQSKFPSLDMEQVTRMTITGQIGSKISVKVDQDSQRETELGNRIQLRYKGDEDEILQTIEAGNTNLSLPNTQFVGYSQQVQGLFGIKTTAKVGHLDLTAIVSQEKGSTEGATFTAGAQGATSFLRDEQYLRYRYFYLYEPFTQTEFWERIGNRDSIVHFELYRYTNSTTDPQALALPTIPDSVTVDSIRAYPTRTYQFQEPGRAQLIEPKDYVLNRGDFILYLAETMPISESDVLACYMEIKQGGSGGVDTIGSKAVDTTSDLNAYRLLLLLLKPKNPVPSHPTWLLEWKNVYNLGAPNINFEGLKVDVYKGRRGTENQAGQNLNVQDDGTPYIQILGLDVTSAGGEDLPDGFIDNDRFMLYLDRGHLVFKNSFPFAPTSYPVATSGDPINFFGDSATYAPNGALLADTVRNIYAQSDRTLRDQASQFYLTISTVQRSTSYSLGRVNIIEGSESVKLNGAPLQRGVDYNINYDVGLITFLTDQVLDPNANVTVDYEYEPFLSIDRKTLFGIRGQYSLGQNFKWGATALFKSEKQPDNQKPRLGEEPSRTLVYDTDFGFRKDLPFLTRLTDALPLVEASSQSNIDVQGEFAQSRPNPNTKGEVFVDDFEASQEVVSLPLLRESWTQASPPTIGSIRGSDTALSTRGRMNWYNRFDPYRRTEIYNKREQAAEDRKQVLTLKFAPGPADTNSWAGIMRSFSAGLQNMTTTQYVEFRIQGNKGKLVLNLGRISEDIDGDGALDSEDLPPQNGILDTDPDEDVGLDGLTDLQEGGGPDPNGDNWSYDENTKDDYSRINGTEGNRGDPIRGWLPDTEDLNANNQVNQANDYLEFWIDLSDTTINNPYLVQGSHYCDNCSNPELGSWWTYRIPIADSILRPLEIGSPTLEGIEFMRLYVTDVPAGDSTQINIADMNLVSYRWREIRIVKDSSVGQDFRVAVVNTRENSTYTPPPGVEEVVDRVTQIGQGEQSLLLNYFNLQPARTVLELDTATICADTIADTGCRLDSTYTPRRHTDQGIVGQTLLASQDYTGYRLLEMFVHGDNAADGTLNFFLRFGSDSLNFYEHHTAIYPGWDPRNHVLVDFNEITALKNYAQFNRPASDFDLVDTTAGAYRVKGAPSLARIEYLEMGVQNLDSILQRSGELWVDELRLTNVRKDVGWAARLSVSANLSDFARIGVSYSSRNYAFQTLTTSTNNVVNASSSENISVNGGFSPSKFLPPSWGLQIPVSMTYTKATTTPFFKTRSDIVVPAELIESEKSHTTSRGISVNPRFSKQTESPIYKYFLIPFTASFSYSQSENSSPTVHSSTSKAYNGSAQYQIAFQKPFSVPIFYWTKYLLLPSKAYNTRLTLFPTNFSTSGTGSQRRSVTEYVSGGARTSSYNRDFSGKFDLKYNPLPNVTADYNYNTIRDLRNPEELNLTPWPGSFKLGTETSFNQAFRTSYSNRMIPFLEQRYGFDAAYQETLERQTDQTRSVMSARSMRAEYGLSWQRLFGKPNDSDKWVTPLLYQPLRKFVRGLFSHLDPLAFGYTRTERIQDFGLLTRPSNYFIFGLITDHKASKLPVASASTVGGSAVGNSYSARSRVTLLGVSATLTGNLSQQESRNTSAVTETQSLEFPSVRVTFSELTKIGLIKRLANSASVDFAYIVKNDFQDQIRDTLTKTRTSETTDRRFSPLLGLNLNFKGNMSTNIKIDHAVREAEQPSQLTTPKSKNVDDAVNLGFRYSFSAPKGIRLPFLSGIKLSSTMNFSTAITWNKSRQYQSVNNGAYELRGDRSSFSVAPQAGYSFSQNLTGGFSARWQDSNDKFQQAKTHSRELGFWVEFRF